MQSVKKCFIKTQNFYIKLNKLTQVLKLYLEEQIKAGANAIQIFDSWASALEYDKFLNSPLIICLKFQILLKANTQIYL